MLSDDTEAASAEGASRPACDHCRARKTRCDRSNPCSSCVTANVSCIFSIRRPEKRQRVHLSARYEDALQDVNERLAEISNTLQTIAIRGELPTQNNNVQLSSHTPKTPDIEHLLDEVTSCQEFRGESSFHAHARDLEKLMSFGLLNVSDEGPSMVRWLADTNANNCRVAGEHSERFGHSLQATYPELIGRNLPPLEVTCRLLRVAHMEPQRVFSDVPVVDIENLSDIWQKVYLSRQETSVFDWITLNVVLLHLLTDLDIKHYTEIGVTSNQVQEMLETLGANCKAAIQSLRLCVAPSIAACQATALLASYCVRSGHRSTACRLITFAARIALDMGLHRSPLDSRNKYSGIFWHVYAMDKYLSFTMGRTATIHHYDITTERRSHLEGHPVISNGLGFAFVDFAHLAGQIHLQLFSATAQAAPNHTRSERADSLASQLYYHMETLQNLSPSNDPTSKSAFDCLSVVAHCYLTLVYQFLSPEQTKRYGSKDVISIAREAIEIFLGLGRRTCARSLAGWSKLLSTLLSLTPMVPILVLTWQTISDPSHDHLDLLEPVLQLVECAIGKSPAVQELWDISSKLFNIASSAKGRGFTPISNEDMMGVQANTWPNDD